MLRGARAVTVSLGAINRCCFPRNKLSETWNLTLQPPLCSMCCGVMGWPIRECLIIVFVTSLHRYLVTG